MLNVHMKTIKSLHSQEIQIQDDLRNKQIWETFDKEEELFRLFIQKSPIPTVIYNANGVFEFMNDRFTDTYGYTLADIPDVNTWWRLAYPDWKYRQEVQAIWKELMERVAEDHAEIKPHQYQVTCKNGRQCIVEIFGTRLGDKNIVHVSDITEHIKMGAAIKKSGEKFAKIFQVSPAVVGISTINDHTIIDVNESFEQHTGYAREEVIGRTIMDLEIWESTQSHDNFLNLLKTQGKIRNLECRFRSKKGDVLFGLLSAEPLDHDGEKCILWEIVNITEHKRTEDVLRKSEEKYSKIFQTSPAAISITGLEDGYVYETNNAFERLLGYSQGEIKGQSVYDLLIWADPKDRERLLRELNDTGSVSDREYQFCTKDDRSIDIRYSADLIDLEGTRCILSVLIDITERKRAEKETHRRAEELEILSRVSTVMRMAQNRNEIYPVLLQQVSDLLNAEGAALALSDASSQEIFFELGYQKWENLTGQRFPQGKGISDQVMGTGKPYRNNDACNHAPDYVIDPKLFNNFTAIACIPLIAKEQTIGALWIGRNLPITDNDMQLLAAIGDMAANAIHRMTLHEDLQDQLEALRQAQSRLVQSEKLAAIGELVSGVAHELNNPLTSVVLYSQLLEQDIHDETMRKNVSKIVSEAIRAGKIVRSLLDFARQQPIKQELVQVNDILKSILDLLGYELNVHDIKFALELYPELPKVMADPHQLTQVFVNLIQNAWQAMSSAHGKGHLKIVTEMGESIYLPSENTRENMVRILIKDDGPGIPEEVMSRIFDPFFTTKPEGGGTGLGLSICHGIISEHKGHIWADSKAGTGATFIVELPVTKAIEAQIEKNNEAGTPLAAREEARILILDDEINIQDVLAKALRRRGYAVDAANNGADGLLCLAKTDYQFILCDIRMPGFNGLDFYKNVESRDPALAKRIIFITGDTANKATQKFIEEHGIQYLVKPFELLDLLQLIHLMNDKQSLLP